MYSTRKFITGKNYLTRYRKTAESHLHNCHYKLLAIDGNSKNPMIRNKIILTAAIDGTSDCPGEPCDTSMPRMIVGTFETIGIEGVCSIANIEFSPPSCEQIMVEILARFNYKKEQ